MLQLLCESPAVVRTIPCRFTTDPPKTDGSQPMVSVVQPAKCAVSHPCRHAGSASGGPAGTHRQHQRRAERPVAAQREPPLPSAGRRSGPAACAPRSHRQALRPYALVAVAAAGDQQPSAGLGCVAHRRRRCSGNGALGPGWGGVDHARPQAATALAAAAAAGIARWGGASASGEARGALQCRA